MEYRECRTCGEILEVNTDNYYIRINDRGRTLFSSPDCKLCYNEKDRNRRRKDNETGSGSERVPLKPNVYVDKVQKEQTFAFLTAMGWKFNEEKGIWYDDIKKTKDGEFIGVWAPKQRLIPADKWEPLLFSQMNYVRTKEKEETIQQFLKDYFVYGLSRKELVIKYDVTESCINDYIAKYKNQLKGILPKVLTKTGKVRKVTETSRTSIKDVPRIRLVQKRVKEKYSEDFVRQIQLDYFQRCIKLKDIKIKYPEDVTFINYIIIKTYELLKKKRYGTQTGG